MYLVYYSETCGLTIPQGWRGGDLPLEEENNPVKQYEFSKLISVTADSTGFDSIYAYDHLVPFYSDDRNKNIFECFTLLSGLAAITRRIKIGQIDTCNSYRNPSLVAKMLSTLDIISNARVELGIGAGWYEQEYVAYGFQFPANVSRIKQLDESLSIIKAMWKDKCASFEGKYNKIKEATCNPKPIQKPHPIVAKHADRHNLFFGTPNEMKTKISILKDGRVSIVLPCRDSIVLPCIIKDTEQEVNQVLMQYKRKDKTLEEYRFYEHIEVQKAAISEYLDKRFGRCE